MATIGTYGAGNWYANYSRADSDDVQTNYFRTEEEAREQFEAWKEGACPGDTITLGHEEGGEDEEIETYIEDDAAYELASVDEDGEFDLMGEFGSEGECIEKAKEAGPGNYAFGPIDEGQYECALLVRADGSALLTRDAIQAQSEA